MNMHRRTRSKRPSPKRGAGRQKKNRRNMCKRWRWSNSIVNKHEKTVTNKFTSSLYNFLINIQPQMNTQMVVLTCTKSRSMCGHSLSFLQSLILVETPFTVLF